MDLAEALDDLRGVRLVGNGDPLVEAGHFEDAGQDVGERQEDQGPAVGDECLFETLLHRHHDAAEATVDDLAALGVAGGSGGVDDRARVVVTGREGGGLEVLIGHTGSGLGELGHQVVLDDQDVALPLGLRREDLAKLKVLDDGQRGTGVGEDPVALRRRGGLVDRDGDGTDDPGAPGEEGPLVAGVAHDGDAVAGLDALGDEALRYALNLFQVLGAGDLVPVTADAAQHGDVVRGLLGILEHEPTEVLDRERFGGGRCGEFGRHRDP